MTIILKPLSKSDARTVISWQYPDEYSIYNANTEDINSEVAYFTDPENHYFGIYEEEDLIGHAVFHAEARVPGGDYEASALDIGAGMRPDYTGQGKGSSIIAEIIEFGREKYQAKVFRATIASWNLRAQKATTNNGFIEVSRFNATNSGKEFIIFIREDSTD